MSKTKKVPRGTRNKRLKRRIGQAELQREIDISKKKAAALAAIDVVRCAFIVADASIVAFIAEIGLSSELDIPVYVALNDLYNTLEDA